MRLLFDLLYIPLALLYLPYLLYQMLALKKNRRGWKQRLGGVPRRAGPQPCIWIHAVSLGEINATPTLVRELRKRFPQTDVVISATTDTGYAAACKLYPDLLVFRYPLDFSIVVAKVMRRIRPAAIVLMELEVWPNLILTAVKRNIPIAIVNGRVTDEKSMRRFRKPILRQLSRWMFLRLACVAAQDEIYAARFEELGVPRDRIAVTGNLKFDTAVMSERITGDAELAAAMGIRQDAPLIVAGSTGPGEEEMLLDAYAALRHERPGLQLAIIPRKPERFDEVAQLTERKGYQCRRRSQRPDGSPPLSKASNSTRPTVFLGDTMGELRKFYSLADVVFVGRTLVPLGGSDLMEVAALAKRMCYGPHVENFAEISGKLVSEKAARKMGGTYELESTLRELLNDSGRAQDMALRAQEIVRRNTGATQRTLDFICDRF